MLQLYNKYIEDIDLAACIQSCQEDVDLYKFADSHFQRPSLSFAPTRNEVYSK